MSSDGSFFMGPSLSAVDIAMAPFAWRFQILGHYRNFVVQNSDEFQRFHRWWAAVENSSSFQATTCDLDELVSVYQRYADNTAKSEVAEAIRTGKALP